MSVTTLCSTLPQRSLVSLVSSAQASLLSSSGTAPVLTRCRLNAALLLLSSPISIRSEARCTYTDRIGARTCHATLSCAEHRCQSRPVLILQLQTVATVSSYSTRTCSTTAQQCSDDLQYSSVNFKCILLKYTGFEALSLQWASHSHQLEYVLGCAVCLALLLVIVVVTAVRRGYCYWQLCQLRAVTCFVCPVSTVCAGTVHKCCEVSTISVIKTNSNSSSSRSTSTDTPVALLLLPASAYKMIDTYLH
eukprot:2974-Heterococcus_DN1.PRE.1